MRRRVFRDMSGLYVPYAWTQKEKPYGVLTANGAEVLRPAGWVFWCPALFHLCLPDITSGHSQWDRSWGALFAGFRMEGAQHLKSQYGALRPLRPAHCGQCPAFRVRAVRYGA